MSLVRQQQKIAGVGVGCPLGSAQPRPLTDIIDIVQMMWWVDLIICCQASPSPAMLDPIVNTPPC